MTRDDLLGFLSHDNVQAFLRVIREGESSQGEEAYTVIFGGSHFNPPPWEHPRKVATVGQLSSSAAGAYQFLARTWDSLARYEFPDFSPINQDCAAVALIARRQALTDVLEGRFDEAVRKCAKEWASLPGSPYGQPTLTLEEAREVYVAYGGRFSGDVPSSVDPPNAEESEVTPMGFPLLPIFAAVLPDLLRLIPSLTAVKNIDNRDERHVARAQVITDTLLKVTQEPNLLSAVQKMDAQPEVLQDVRRAIDDVLPQISEAGGGGIAAARTAAAIADGDWRKVIFTFPFLLAGALLPLVYAVVLAALVKVDWLATFTDDARMMVITAVINLILGAIIGYVYGQSIQQRARATDAR